MNTENTNVNWFSKRTRLMQSLIIAVPALIILYFIYIMGWIPTLKSSESKELQKSSLSKDIINTTSKTSKLEVPDINNMEFIDETDRPEIKMMQWVWFANAPIFGANGGLNTTVNSLMDQYKLNLKIIINNSVDDMKREQLLFIKEYADGITVPTNGVALTSMMGDGALSYISTMNSQILKVYGEKYRLKVIGLAGFSMGEDCIMGPQSWVDNPKENLKGAVISVVIGDGDHIVGVRFASSDNGVLINPDPDTYDKNALNFVPATDNDFLKAAEDVISKRRVVLKVKNSNGSLTGETIEKVIEGAGTWWPGDRRIVENTDLVKVVSTSQYPNQMPCVIVGCDAWMQANKQLVVNFLSATLTAGDQIKQYPDWYKYICELAPKVFCVSESDCSETANDWMIYGKPGGAKMKNINDVLVPVGGTQMSNLSDNKKYFGIKGGNNYYKSVYDYCDTVLQTLNPAGFLENVGQITPYDQMVDLRYLKDVNIQSSPTEKVDYSKVKGEVFAERNWTIEFQSGSSSITPQGEQALEELFNQLNIAENLKVRITGHTDNQGSDSDNMDLSIRRANAVKIWLIKRSNNNFPSERFIVQGKGETEPLGGVNSKDRRVQIELLK